MAEIKKIEDRKAFNFFRSYWNVGTMLPDTDRLAFYDAIIKRQFTKQETKLSGMAEFAYVSQKHNIDNQINGFETVGLRRTNILPNKGASVGANDGASVQVQVQVQDEVKEEIKHTVFDFDSFWKMYDKSSDKKKCQAKYAKIPEDERAEIKMKLPLYIATIKDKKYQKNPITYLNGKNWNDIEDLPVSAKTYDFSKTDTNNGVIRF